MELEPTKRAGVSAAGRISVPKPLSLEYLAYFYKLLLDAGYDPEDFLRIARPLASEDFYQSVRELAGINTVPDFEICGRRVPPFQRWMFQVAFEDDPSGETVYKIADKLWGVEEVDQECLDEILNESTYPSAGEGLIRARYHQLLSPTEEFYHARDLMLVPVQCKNSCGFVLRESYEVYDYLVSKGVNPEALLDAMGLERSCCRVSYMAPEMTLWRSEIAERRALESGKEEVRRVYEHFAPKRILSPLAIVKFNRSYVGGKYL